MGSRYGSEVDIAAPFAAFSMWTGGLYAHSCGTSMSAPVVTGVAALVWSLNPSWTAAQVRQRLQATAIPHSPLEQYGAGRVDALYAAYAQPSPYSATVNGPGAVRPNARCSYSATTDSPSAPFTYEWFVDGASAGFGDSYFYHTAGSSAFALSVLIQDAQGRLMNGIQQVMVSEIAPECLDQ